MFLKYAVIPGVSTKFIKNWSFNKNSYILCYKSLLKVRKIYFEEPKLTQISCVPFIYQKYRVHNSGKPSVLLGGILAFVGLQKSDENEESNLLGSLKRVIRSILGLQITEEKDESTLILTIKRSILLIKRKEFDKAEQMLHIALKLAQDLQDEDGITYVYDVLANLAFEAEQYSKAEKLFVSVLQRLIAKGEEKDSNKVVDISLKLAKIFENNKDLKKAEQGYLFCIDSLDPKLKDEDEDTLALWGMSMDWYARFLLGVNRNSEALKCFKKAYDMCVRVNGLEHEQTVVLLNDLGTVSSLLGDTDSALKYLEQAKRIGKKLPGMRDLSAIYINLGQIYLMREMYKESILACQEGMEMAQTHEDEVSIAEANECLNKINQVFKKVDTSKEI